jgi:hypothetical protein
VLIGDSLQGIRRFWLVGAAIYSGLFVNLFEAEQEPLETLLIGVISLVLLGVGYGLHRLVPVVLDWCIARHMIPTRLVTRFQEDPTYRKDRIRVYADTLVVLAAWLPVSLALMFGSDDDPVAGPIGLALFAAWLFAGLYTLHALRWEVPPPKAA